MKKLLADILKQMTIPLLQNLLHYIDNYDENLIRLYALAVVPQAIGCSSSDFLDLRNVLISDTDFNLESLDDEFFYVMHRFQKCIRISCSDLKGNSSPNSTLLELVDKTCYNSTASSKNLAGFDAVSDVYSLSMQEVRAAPDLGDHVNTSYIKGLVNVDSKMVILLDINELLGNDNVEDLHMVTSNDFN